MKMNDKIKVHLYGTDNKEIKKNLIKLTQLEETVDLAESNYEREPETDSIKKSI